MRSLSTFFALSLSLTFAFALPIGPPQLEREEALHVLEYSTDFWHLVIDVHTLRVMCRY